MSRWEERVSAALDAVVALRMSVDALHEDGVVIADHIESVERVADVQRYAEGVLTRSDLHYLFPPQTLKTVAQHAQAAASEMAAFRKNKQNQHLVNANSNLDSMLPALLQLPPPVPSEQVEGLRESVISFRRSVGQYLSSIERQKDDLSGALDALQVKIVEIQSDVSQQKSRLDAAITEYQQQYSQAENSRRDGFNSLLSEVKSNFSGALESVKEEAAEELEQIRDEVETTSGEQKVTFGHLMSEFESSAKEQIETLKTFRDQAQDLLQVIGSTGMAGEFQKAATSAKKTGWFWQGISIASMAGLIGFAILAYQSAADSAIDWAGMGTRLFVAISFGVLAAFSVRQADRYHESELRNRRYQLELSSIDPYLAGLPDEKRDEVKIRLADRLFGGAGAQGIHQESGGKVGAGTTLDVARLALETVQEVIKAKK